MRSTDREVAVDLASWEASFPLLLIEVLNLPFSVAVLVVLLLRLIHLSMEISRIMVTKINKTMMGFSTECKIYKLWLKLIRKNYFNLKDGNVD